MLTRRQMLGAMIVPAVAAAVECPASARERRRAVEAARRLVRPPGAAEDLARDEAFWFQVGQAFTVDRSIVNLNNGGVSPAPAVVQEAMKRRLDFSNSAPPPWALWEILQPQKEAVRERLARAFGADPEEIAITRNASEGLQICQLGMALRRGDEVLTTDQDYPRMVSTFRQRVRREGIVLRQCTLPVPAEDPDEVVARFREQITDRTRLILMCHVINLTGQILPVAKVVAMARERGIPVIVDGAHAVAHFPFRIDELGCDYYATSLHKWLFAPHGTGMLYVRRERIAGLWPLMAAPPALDDDIRKFEEIGTHPLANPLSIAEALTFHEGLGPEHKAARLVHLRDRWARRLLEGHDRVRLHTSLRPGFAGGIANVQVEGLDTAELQTWLWERHRVLTVAIRHEQFEGLRVSPSVYTRPEELDRFCDAIDHAIARGLT
ncbi:MAG: aminotransferase class V-fold PLP-dependent enzyme [Planctomycetota bacterium]|jgi:selenocysteine lyase/cysteine desulfurase